MVDKRVQIQASIKDAEPWLPLFLDQIEKLDYPENLIRYAFVTAPSKDRTMEILFDWLKDKPNYFLRHTAMPSNYVSREKMWMSGNYARQFAITKMVDQPSPDFVFICDCDVTTIPPRTLQRLVDLDVDIVAPYVFLEPIERRRFYDTWAFRFLSGPRKGEQHPENPATWYAENMEGALEIEADLDKRIIPMMSVGANPVLIKREVLEECWYEGNEAIVGFCDLARYKGFEVWSYPDIEVIHCGASV